MRPHAGEEPNIAATGPFNSRGGAHLSAAPRWDDLQPWMKRSSLAIALVFAGVAATLLAWLVGLAWVVISVV